MEAAVHGTSCYVPSCGTVPPPRRLPSKAGSEVYYGTWLEAAVSACALPDTDYAILSTEFAPSRRREAKLFRFKAAASALRRSIRHLETAQQEGPGGSGIDCAAPLAGRGLFVIGYLGP